MSTQAVSVQKVSPESLEHDDKVIIDGQRGIIDNVYPAADGAYALEVSFAALVKTVIIPAGETVDRI